MRTFGYMRKECPEPIVSQVMALNEYDCDQLFVEDESVKVSTEFDAMVGMLKERDTVVVKSLKTFGKTSHKLRKTFELFSHKQVRLISLNEDIDTDKCDTSIYDLVLILDETDRYTCMRLTKEGLKDAKSRGVSAGRPRISREKVKLIHDLRKQERYSMRQISEICGVSVGTVCRYLKALEAK